MRLLFILLSLPVCVAAGPTIVGNGDDGSDLEKTTKITSGILLSTRDQALEVLRKMNVKGVRGLGQLAHELKNAEIYLVESNIKPQSAEKGLEISEDQKFVYARTFAQANASVRFFPAAVMLSEEQLIKLHIHEALHRALPEAIRENETAVADITLAIASPNASFDLIESTVQKHLQTEKVAAAINSNSSLAGGSSTDRYDYRPTAKLERPSTLQYSYTIYDLKDGEKELLPIKGLHRIDSFLHPFGGPRDAFGLGISFSYIQLLNRSYMGPMQVSARYLLSTWREFDIEGFADFSMYSLANEELKSVENARDVSTFGISMKRNGDRFYTENFLSYSAGGKKDIKLGNVGYEKTFAPVTTARISFGGKIGKFFIGGKTDFILTESSTLVSKTQSYDSIKERVRMVKMGPEFGYRSGAFQGSIFAQSIVDGTIGYNLSEVANLMGEGAGQSYTGASIGYIF